jgi:hypothetical protein
MVDCCQDLVCHGQQLQAGGVVDVGKGISSGNRIVGIGSGLIVFFAAIAKDHEDERRDNNSSHK